MTPQSDETPEAWWLESADLIVSLSHPKEAEEAYRRIRTLVTESRRRTLREIEDLVSDALEKHMLGFDETTSQEALLRGLAKTLYHMSLKSS